MLRAVFALLIAVACASGCAPKCDDQKARLVVYEETFENLCDGAPCGWAVLQGPTGSVNTVTTIHAGETGVSFAGDAVIIRSNGSGNRGPNGAITFPLEVRGYGRCDENSTLRIRVRTQDPVTSEQLTYLATPAFGTEWQAQVESALVPVDGRSEVYSDVGRSVLYVEIEKTGQGNCEIDDFEIGDAAFRARTFCD